MNSMPKSKKVAMTEIEMLLAVANSALMLANDISEVIESDDQRAVAQKWFKILANQTLMNKLLDELNTSDTIRVSQN